MTDLLEQEVQTVVTRHVGAGSWAKSPGWAAMFVTTVPPLQPVCVMFPQQVYSLDFLWSLYNKQTLPSFYDSSDSYKYLEILRHRVSGNQKVEATQCGKLPSGIDSAFNLMHSPVVLNMTADQRRVSLGLLAVILWNRRYFQGNGYKIYKNSI